MAKQAKNVSVIEEVRAAIIRDQWGMVGAEKVARYVGKFFDRQRIGKKIVARVVGNHGTYTVSLSVKAGRADGSCSCYIGRDGCHHCAALANPRRWAASAFSSPAETRTSSTARDWCIRWKRRR